MISNDELFAGLKFLLRHAPLEFRVTIEKTIADVKVISAAGDLDKLRARPTEDMEVSIRTGIALDRMGLKTVGAVEKFVTTQDDAAILLAGKKHFLGKKCLKEIREVLKNSGFKVVPNVTDARGGFIDAGGKVNKSGRID